MWQLAIFLSPCHFNQVMSDKNVKYVIYQCDGGIQFTVGFYQSRLHTLTTMKQQYVHYQYTFQQT